MKTKLINNNMNWININVDQGDDIGVIKHEYAVDESIITYALDKNERAHLEYNKLTKTLVLIYNVPHCLKIDNHYETIPMTFIICDETLITITNDNNQYIADKMASYNDINPDTSVFELLFNSLFIISECFFPYVEEMNQDRKIVSEKLKIKTSKQNLLNLSDLETGILHFIASSKQNVTLLEQIKFNAIYKQITPNEIEELEDAYIEAKQLAEMCDLSSHILSQLSQTYNNILNNNLNDTMRVLTILSLLLSIPTIITGFFGMNMPLPFATNPLGWIFTIIISVVLWLLVSFILRTIIRK